MPKLNKFAACLLFAIGFNVQAEVIALDYKQATVPEVVQSLVREVLRRDYVISPEVATLDKKISVQVRQIDTANVLGLLGDVLKTVQVEMIDRGGVLYLEREKPPVPQPVQAVQPVQPAINQPMNMGMYGMSPYGNNQFSQGFQQALPIPEEIDSYMPKGKTVEFLQSVVRAAGCLVVDPKGRSDLVVFSGKKEAVEKARAILQKVDTAPVSVTVRAVLVEFTSTNAEGRSMSFALSALAGKLGVSLKAGTSLANALTFKNATLDAAVSVIESDSRFKYVAEPTVRVNDGETAKFTVGAEVPTRGAIVQDKIGNSQQSIDYKTAGVVLNIVPRVLDGMVTVQVGQQISSFALTTTSNIDSPTILKREASTTVSAKPGELIVIAGMDEDRSSTSSSGLPFFPSWLRSKNDEQSRSQLVLLLEVKPQEI